MLLRRRLSNPCRDKPDMAPEKRSCCPTRRVSPVSCAEPTSRPPPSAQARSTPVSVTGFAVEDAEAALPKIMWVTAEDVAKSAVDGMASGRLVVIPGTVNRIAASLSQVTPRSLLLPLLAKGHPGLR